MDPQIAALMKAMASLMTMVENTTCQIRGLCHEGFTPALEPEANLLTLIAIDDLATDLENATIDCRLRMELSFGVQREQSADSTMLTPMTLCPWISRPRTRSTSLSLKKSTTTSARIVIFSTLLSCYFI